MGDLNNRGSLRSNTHSVAMLNICPTTSVLELHHNSITSLEGLQKADGLLHIDLSSNLITKLQGLANLINLRTLNLSSNRITKIEGLRGLRSLVRLDLSFNVIKDLTGLRDLNGPAYKLTVLQLQGNKLANLKHIISFTSGLTNLRQLTLMDTESSVNNPICQNQSYWKEGLAGLPQLTVLDNRDRQGRPVQMNVLADVPELTDFMDCISNSDLSKLNKLERRVQDAHIANLGGDASTIGQNPSDNCSHNMGVQLEQTNAQLRQNSLSPATERRLVSLENQLSSLVALQLMRLNQPGTDLVDRSASDSESDCVVRLQTPTLPAGAAATAATSTDTSPAEAVARQRRKARSRAIGEINAGDRQLSQGRAEKPTEQTKTMTGLTPKTLQALGNRSSGMNQIRSPLFVSPEPVRVKSQPSLDEHPPGAPKRPSSGLSNQRYHGHPMHGRPILSRTPSNPRITQADNSRVTSTGIPGPDLKSPTILPRNQMETQRRSDRPDSKHFRISSQSPAPDVAGRSLGQLLKELDSERSKRKGTEQLCRDLTARILRLEATASDEAKALDATIQLKEAFVGERRNRLDAEMRLREMESRLTDVLAEVEEVRQREKTEKQRFLEETEKLSSTLRDLTKDYQDVVYRAERAEEKFDDVQRLLRTREMELKELLDKRYTPDSPEVTQLISARIDAAVARNEETIKGMIEKLNESNTRFHNLEDEFRLALRIEAERYNELCSAAESLKEKLSMAESISLELERREDSSRQLVSEMTATIKEQKNRSINQQKANLLMQHNQKERIVTLEAHLEEAKSRILEAEKLRKEYKQLKAEMVGQESLIAGLRAEKRAWGEELAQQTSALAQDRGRLEAKIEAQTMEISSLKKTLETEADHVKIKAKIIDDQVDTIRNLKKGLMDHQEEIKRVQDDAINTQRTLEKELQRLRQSGEEQKVRIERLVTRKEELKDVIAQLEGRIEDLHRHNDSLDQRSCERANQLDHLEKQVEQLRSGWENDQQALITERDIAREQIHELEQQMERIDNGFRQQLTAVTEAKQIAVNQARDDAEQMRSTCESRVADVEAEMRTVLFETESTRSLMEARLNKVSNALMEFGGVTNMAIPLINACHSSQSDQFAYRPLEKTSPQLSAASMNRLVHPQTMGTPSPTLPMYPMSRTPEPNGARYGESHSQYSAFAPH